MEIYSFIHSEDFYSAPPFKGTTHECFQFQQGKNGQFLGKHREDPREQLECQRVRAIPE